MQKKKQMKERHSLGIKLLGWHQFVDRDMPWKKTQNPYYIWISEIILQQTRVVQGWTYYERFITAFPSIEVLSAAQEDDVMSVWQGLGYYSRARNILKAARIIMQEHKGIFPSRYDEIRSLPGVGPYTAAAVASFAFGLPYAVLDGNVFRILSRYYGEYTAIDSAEAKRIYAQLAQETLSDHDPAAFNQAIMDLGALICTPSNPLCNRCPLNQECAAFREEKVNILPIKGKKKALKDRYFHYVLIIRANSCAVQKRISKDIWQGLYELPLVESVSNRISQDSVRKLFFDRYNIDGSLRQMSQARQLLTHQRIHYNFYLFEEDAKGRQFEFVKVEDISKLAFPKKIKEFLFAFFLNNKKPFATH